MNYVVFDTETTSLDKPFCYNIGYSIRNENNQILAEKEFIVEQIWHNLPLFSTAYYAEKRPIYVNRMRARAVEMEKFGYICQEMVRDFRKYDVKLAFAYNSQFDEKVFNFNCDWFKCINPFDNIEIKDIRGFVHNFLIDEKFKAFCDKFEYFTETGNYSTTAETIYRYLTNNTDFMEEHTALSDSQIEADILYYCLQKGGEIYRNYEVKRSIKREITKTLHIKDSDNNNHFYQYKTIRINKDKTEIVLK